jgi:N utilization substance protein A
MKGSRVQAIIRELRGEKIDIIEWSEEPSVFAANALSPAKVNQVRITDIESRQMEVIVNEDQLSLAIGKRGQNVRLATKLVGWNIDIRSEEELKREVAAQMGAMIASGESVPLERLEGMNPAMVATLAEHGVGDIESLANATVDDIADFLDVSIDQAEALIGAAQAVVESALVAEAEEAGALPEASAEAAPEETPATEEATAGTEGETAEAAAEPEVEMAEESEGRQTVEQHAASFEADPNAEVGEVEPSEAMTAEGYDEAVETRPPFMAEDLSPDNLLAKDAAEPVALTEVEQMSADELLLQGAGRDLRPDTITPAPDISSAEAAVIQNRGAYAEEERPSTLDVETDGIAEPVVREAEEDSPASPVADLGGEASAPEVQVSSAPTPASEAGPTAVEHVAEDEAEDASGNA